MDIRYWNKEQETLDRDSLRAQQLESLKETVGYALQTAFYKRRLAKAGITSVDDIRSLDDLQRIPYTTKDDLREAYPDGLLAVPMNDVVRLHTSSGTTGTPTVIYHNQHDLDSWTNLVARCIVSTGVTSSDVFQNMMGYGLFTGGLGLHYGAERVGTVIIPASSGNTNRQLRLMKDFRTTVIHATPSYMLHLYNKIQESEYKRSDFCIRKGFTGAEAYSASTHKKIEELFELDVYNSYGLSEMNGPGVAFECCLKDDMHIWEDAYYVEMLRKGTEEPVDAGEEGELVLTTLQRQATPLLRYRTGDLTSLRIEPCACGRTHRRITRIKGRADDMLIINGVNIYPSQIEAVIMKVPEVGTNYQICIEKAGSLDKLTVKTEIYSKMFTGDLKALDALKVRLQEELKANIIVKPVVELHEPGALPVQEGKAIRVFDLRTDN
ncbi:MAG: phenylacetate--CoA ligase family protein [Spartobacteria bacterium]|nr:phenylacetate--CoA ligase family protein [Spartobacteria bacterium]